MTWMDLALAALGVYALVGLAFVVVAIATFIWTLGRPE